VAIPNLNSLFYLPFILHSCSFSACCNRKTLFHILLCHLKILRLCNSLTSYNGGRAFHTTLASCLESIVTFADVNERFCIAASTSASSFHESEELVRESYNPCVIVTESTEDLPSEELTAPPSEEERRIRCLHFSPIVSRSRFQKASLRGARKLAISSATRC
jgi:hypothetical protein